MIKKIKEARDRFLQAILIPFTILGLLIGVPLILWQVAKEIWESYWGCFYLLGAAVAVLAVALLLYMG